MLPWPTLITPRDLRFILTVHTHNLAVIAQNNRPLAFFSRILRPMQQKYSVTKQELLAIVEILKEFKGMLWGQTLTVYTDHKNLMQDALGLTSD